MTVVRDGKAVRLGPVSPELTDGAYRLGFALRGEALGPVESSMAGDPGHRHRHEGDRSLHRPARDRRR